MRNNNKIIQRKRFTMQQETPQTIDTVLTRMFALHRHGIKPGLERIEELMQQSGRPHTKFPSIHVAGTNGKGSVCSILAAILSAAGYRVGLYTSPHVRHFRERIRINGVPITDEEIIDLAAPMIANAEKTKTTFFEITTAMAFQYFAQKKVDIAIIETGMGGRLDATNVLHPLVSVITSIDYDHTDFLGTSLTSIAEEKAGIIKYKVPAVIGEPRQNLRPVFERKAAAADTIAYFPDDDWTAKSTEYRNDMTMSVHVTAPMGELKDLRSALIGEHQCRNILTALYTLRLIIKELPVSEKAVREGLINIHALTGLTGRVQLLQENPRLVLDVGHNSSGMTALRLTLERCFGKEPTWNLVFAAMSDKKAIEMLNNIRPICKSVFLCVPKVERALPLSLLHEAAQSVGFTDIHDCTSVAEAVQKARNTHEPCIIAGSFYLADEALSYLQSQ
jgi:dihydrofolate synthase/folylpolyglutamate synthase